MTHYDGPAFFRKYYTERKKLGLQEPNLQKHNHDSLQWSAPVAPTSKRHAKTTSQHDWASKGQVQASKATLAVRKKEHRQQSNLVEKTRAFQPQVRLGKSTFYGGKQETFTATYQRAIAALEPNPTDLIMLANETMPVPDTDPTIEMEDVTASSDSATPTATPVVDQADENTDVSSVLQNENENENTVDNSSDTKPKRDHSKGLGHSLADILQAEQGQADHLSLFAEAPDDEQHEKKESQSQPPVEEPKEFASTPSTGLEELPQSNAEVPEDNSQATKAGSSFEQPQSFQTEPAGYHFPQLELLKPPVQVDEDDLDTWIADQAEKLDDTLQAFHVDGHVVDWTNGPTVTQFQVKLALGVKVSKVTNLNDDLKLALAAKDIRIEAPIPGRSTVGIEIPNPKPHPVMLREILGDSHFQTNPAKTAIAMGMNIEGQPITADLKKMPHALIAGATGSGKSVFINSLLLSLLYHATPKDLRMLLIDPKAVELAPYNEIPHLLAPVISKPQEAAAALKWVTEEMDRRYERLTAAGVRNIEQYNHQAQKADHAADRLPYILVVIDELADLMMTSASEVQDYIVRITQKARAAGIHLVVATQRPSVDIVTGTIKNNIPTRVAFMVSSQVDSRTIIDQAGAERLLGKGDMLYLGNGANKPERLQGAFVTSEEVEKVTDFVRTQGKAHYEFQPESLLKSANRAATHDELWDQVLAYIAGEDNVSTSKLQRVFSIGYNRAASIIDDLEQQNFVSGQQGSKPRDVYLTKDQFAQLNL
ncbi:DNA translocase FtsK [Fructilactobacillus hinvesii]|uniref:DNA translocase FtsK n=1 Tax=Fructilactobacillus hinvesii TaxID=2940300 RepID=A0ABY5BUD5_9LACO|nr:DNA translocase FtsK [Fructilactobacillus hinvesii]USS87606.1 DNA translocase FtsK [Fructilactobacillus hinvesii]